MKTSILTGFLNAHSVNLDSLKFHYDFSLTSGQVVFNNLFSKQQQVITDDSSFHLDSFYYPSICDSQSKPNVIDNSGFFQSENFLSISKDITNEDWSFFINYSGHNNAPTGSSRILLSSVDSSLFNSGFILGINNSNRLFFEFAKEGGKKETLTHLRQLKKANSISISKTKNNINLNIFDFLEEKNYSEHFDISGYKESHRWRIGNLPSSISGYSGFSGKIFDIIYFDKCLSSSLLEDISDLSFASGYQPKQTIASGRQESQITQAVLNPTGIISLTGIIGTKNVFNYEIDNIKIYKTENITGVVTGRVTEYITGEAMVTRNELITIEENKFYNYDFVSSFSDDSILFLKPIAATDKYEIYTETTKTNAIGITPYLSVNKNNPFVFDYKNQPRLLLGKVNKKTILNNNLETEISGFYLDERLNSPLLFNVYLNGSGLFSERQYEFIQAQTDFFNFLRIKDTNTSATSELIYDIISGAQFEINFTGQSSVENSNFMGQDIYLNGLKLISGINYTQQNNTTQILNNNQLSTGKLFSMPRGSNSLLRYTGLASQTVQLSSGIIDGERVWLNGLRQLESVDYIKISSINLQTSNNFIFSFSDSIYNNNKQFFNI